jgi:hypothetical protein
MDAMQAAISAPTYLGQAPHHPASFEVVKHVTVTEAEEAGKILRRFYVLVAIRLRPDDGGDYRVVSGYTIKEEQVNARRIAGRLLQPKN